MLTPGLNPSLRLSSVGSTWTSCRLVGIDSASRFTSRPVALLRLRTVKWLLGQGNRQLEPGAAIVSQRFAVASAPHSGQVLSIRAVSEATSSPRADTAYTVSCLAPHAASTSFQVFDRGSDNWPRPPDARFCVRRGPLRLVLTTSSRSLFGEPTATFTPFASASASLVVLSVAGPSLALALPVRPTASIAAATALPRHPAPKRPRKPIPVYPNSDSAEQSDPSGCVRFQVSFQLKRRIGW